MKIPQNLKKIVDLNILNIDWPTCKQWTRKRECN